MERRRPTSSGGHLNMRTSLKCSRFSRSPLLARAWRGIYQRGSWRNIVRVALTLFACLLSQPTAMASDSQVERVSLTGLTALSVVVEDLAQAATQNGLTSAALQTDVERRLRQAKISVTPDADAYLYVHVTVADPGGSSPLPYFVEGLTHARGDAS